MSADRPVVDFDHHSQDYKYNWESILEELRANNPVAWTENYGGFWIVTRHADAMEVFRDAETFTTTHVEPNDGKSYTGVQIPSWPDIALPMEVDGQAHARFRRLLNPWFAPGELEKLQPRIRQFVDWVIDQHIESGSIDFVNDLGNPVPAMVTLDFLGLNVDEWQFYAPPMHGLITYEPSSREFEDAVAGYGAIMTKITEELDERRRAPRKDRLTELVTFNDADGPIPQAELLSLVGTLLTGGVDTSTILMAYAIDYLDKHPELRSQLASDPTLMLSAREEFLRHGTPGQTHVRTATKDTVIAGQKIQAGERVLISIASANRDQAVFDRANEVIVDRFPNHHLAFGVGPHRCIGAALAREEFTAIVGGVLERMPDYRLEEGAAERYPQFGISPGWVRMPATFTPSPKRGLPTPW